MTNVPWCVLSGWKSYKDDSGIHLGWICLNISELSIGNHYVVLEVIWMPIIWWISPWWSVSLLVGQWSKKWMRWGLQIHLLLILHLSWINSLSFPGSWLFGSWYYLTALQIDWDEVQGLSLDKSVTQPESILNHLAVCSWFEKWLREFEGSIMDWS